MAFCCLCLFLGEPCVDLQSVIVAFPGHISLPFEYIANATELTSPVKIMSNPQNVANLCEIVVSRIKKSLCQKGHQFVVLLTMLPE